MFLGTIEVEFGPHWADEWMVWLTAGSIVATIYLGWLAYRNGRSAVKIAADASKRDADHRDAEQSRLFYDERTDVARAVITALVSLDLLLYMKEKGGPDDEVRKLVTRANETKLQAMVQIDLGVRDQNPEELKDWLLRIDLRLRERAHEHGIDADFLRLRGNAITIIQGWRNEKIRTSDLPDPDIL